MTDVARQNVGRRGAFAQIVAQCGVARLEVEIELRGVVNHHHDVNAGVNLGMVISALWHTEQCIHFGQPLRQQTAFTQDVEHARGRLLHQAAGDFLPDALRDEGGCFAVRHHVLHQLHGFGGDGKFGPACGEPCQPQDAHGVFDKGG